MLDCSNPDPKLSYNWWLSNSKGYPRDWGPWLRANQLRWKEINPYGSGKFFPDSAMGTPGGDRSKYFLLSNGEIDFDQIFTDTLPKVDASWTPAPSQYSINFVQGAEIRFLYSFGPFDIPPGDSIFAAIALVGGENLHIDSANGSNNLPDNPYQYYKNLDFSNLVHNAQKAQEVYESGYTLPPPGPPDDFTAYVMDNTTIRLSWSTKNRPNLKGYNIYRSLNSDDPSPEKINPELVTNRLYLDQGLIEGVYYTYWIACVDQNNLEGKRTKFKILTGRPRTPQRLEAETSKDQVHLFWFGSREKDLMKYRIYRKDYGNFMLVDSVGVVTDFLDKSVTNGVIYHYRITAVDLLGLESFFSDSVYALPMAFDQGIGIIDRTPTYYANRISTRNFGDSVDAFYYRMMQNQAMPWTYLIHDDINGPWEMTLRDLSPFPVILIHSESINKHIEGWPDGSTALIIRHYLRAGGRLIFEGSNNYDFFFSYVPDDGDSGFCDSRYLRVRDSLFCSYLFLENVFIPSWKFYGSGRNEEFVGALSRISEYPDLEIDSNRVDSCIYRTIYPEIEAVMGKLPGVGYIIPKDTSVYPVEVIYTFHSAYDTSALEGKPVAIRYLGDDYKFVFLNFPLYYIKEEQTIHVLQQALWDLGVIPTTVSEEGEEVVSIVSFSLKQNYPNPFNSATTIPFTIPYPPVNSSRFMVNSPIPTALEIYNILGQRVKTLVDERKLPGKYEVNWDGKDEKGNEVGSGIYLYKLKAGDYQQVKKMVLLK